MIYVVGIGPGKREDMTIKALEVIKKVDVIIGYKTYINLISSLITNQECIVNGMRGEVERCKKAYELALTGKDVAVISSGDSGVYGMAGLVFEIIAENNSTVAIEIIPGVTSANAAAALLGAPIMHDHVYISLSDLMTDWVLIQKRIDLAGQGDFVICLFNPKSKGRPTHINKAREILLKYRLEETVVGIVKNAKREDESTVITTLKDMLDYPIDMTTMVIIGNSMTYKYSDFMITPRGYNVRESI